MKTKENVYRLTMTESQLRLMIEAVEDWHRFLSGECGMSHATSYLNAADCVYARNALKEIVSRCVNSELAHTAQSYDRAGSGCPRDAQRRAIAMSYMLYREPLHVLTCNDSKTSVLNVYKESTLTCQEQGPLIKVEKID